MSRRKRSDRKDERESLRQPTEDSLGGSRQTFGYVQGMWWLGLWLLLLSSTPFFLIERWRITDLPDRSLLGQAMVDEVGIWDPWLATIADATNLAESSFVLGSITVSLLLSVSAIRSARLSTTLDATLGATTGHSLGGTPWPVFLLVVIGLSQVEPRPTLMSLVCMALVGFLTNRAESVRSAAGCWQGVAFACLLLILAIASTLDVGFVALSLSFLVIVPLVERHCTLSGDSKKGLLIVTAWAALLIIPTVFSSGYLGALLRPVSWMWLELPEELMPSMTPIWRYRDFGWHYGLAAVAIVLCWIRIFVGRATLGQMLLWTLLTVIGLGCVRHFWLVIATLLMTDFQSKTLTVIEPSETPKDRPRRSRLLDNSTRLASMVAVAVGVLVIVFHLVTNASTILASDVITRSIAPSQWDVSGVVMLGNLEQVADWQGPAMRSVDGRDQYQPVLTDRWDVFHAEYANYLAVYNEWTHWKREAYLRSDGSWGGYQSVFAEWEPVLVVVDSRDLVGIHAVSLDSQWKAIGVDPRKLVFAPTEAEATKPYIQYANLALATLEFPRPGADIDFQRVVALSSGSQEALRVSAALTSLRLPFAGLRVLPSSGSAQRSESQLLALAELAHRTYRYSGTFSILDNARALGKEALRSNSDAGIVESTRRYTRNLRQKVEANQKTNAALPLEQVRQLLRQGNVAQANFLLSNMEASTAREFYRILAAAADQPAATTLSLLELLPLADIPPELAAECSFYRGCLANEVGDFGKAQSALVQSLNLDGSSPFAAVATFYISQIGGFEPVASSSVTNRTIPHDTVSERMVSKSTGTE